MNHFINLQNEEAGNKYLSNFLQAQNNISSELIKF